jgi:hypothetical protein
MTIVSSYDSFCEAFEASHGFSPLGLYCIATGKRIGTFDGADLDSLVGSWSGDDQLIDDVATRLLASMRPSIRWNVMREETLDEMRKTQPIDTLAYLLNRLFAAPEHRTQRFESRLESYRDRIRLHHYLTHYADVDALTKILHMLIEVDAKAGLEQLIQPFSCEVFMQSDDPVTLVGRFYAEQIRIYARKVAEDEAQSRWTKYGNPLARKASASITRENRPPSQTAIKKAAKSADSKFFEDLFDELTAPRANPTNQVPVTKPAMKPLKLGRLNIARKA